MDHQEPSKAEPKEEEKKHAKQPKRPKAKKKKWKVDSQPYDSKYALPCFLLCLKQNLLENQFSKFLDIFKQLLINIFLIEALKQM